MSVLLLKEDNTALEDANRAQDPDQILACLRSYYKNYPDENTISTYRTGLEKNEEIEFDTVFPVYEGNVNVGIEILINHIKENLHNFLNLSEQELFLEIVQTLINVNSLNIANVFAAKLCKSFLKLLASTQERYLFKKTYEILMTDISHYMEPVETNKGGEPIPKIWCEQFLDDHEVLLGLLRNTYGKNYRYLKNIYLRINHFPLSKDIDNKVYCIFSDKECSKFIPNEESYFIAFPFRRSGIEDKIIEAFKNVFRGLEPKIARDNPEIRTVLCQACQFILSSKFGIYVLDKYSLNNCSGQDEYFPNPNVMLELGLSIGRGKNFIILLQEGTKVPSDLAGYVNRIQYNNIDNIPDLISQHNFTNFIRKINNG